MNNDLYSVSLPTTDHNHVVFNGVSSYMIPSNTHEQLMARNPFPSAVQEEIGNPFPDIYSGQANLGTPLPAPTMPKPFGQSLFNIDNPSAFNSFGPPRHDEFLQVMSTVHPSYHIIESTYPGWNLNNCNNLLPRNELSLSLGSCSEKSSVVTQVTSRDTEELTLYCGPSGSVHFPHVSGSRYFGLSEQILAEVASYALGNFDEVDFNKGLFVVDSDEFPSTSGEIKSQEEIQNLVLEKNPEKTELLKMLQMVNHRCSQYLDRIQNVVAIFHSATNSSSPQRLARFATNTILSAFRNMRERITRQLLISGQERGRGSMRGKAKAFESSFIQKQGGLQELGRKDQQSWRPQRGLPERSVSVLRAWMFQNFLHPYPKDNDKHLLALQSGLTRNQVSNWFINARVRLWKPMIEEMYSESKKHQTEEGSEGDFRSHGNISNQRPE